MLQWLRNHFRRRAFIRMLQRERAVRAQALRQFLASRVFQEGNYCVYHVAPWWYVGQVDKPKEIVDRFALRFYAVECAKKYAAAEGAPCR